MKSIVKIVKNVPKSLRYRNYSFAIYTRVETDIKNIDNGCALDYVSDIYSLVSYLTVSVGLDARETNDVIMDAVQMFLNDLDK